MRTLRRVCASAALALTGNTTWFPQHYTQTDLVSNMAGVTLVTRSRLRSLRYRHSTHGGLWPSDRV